MSPPRRAADNLLIRGDALNALTSLSELPEFAAEYVGKVKLAYLDPPFNTQQSFLHYDDALEHSVWLTMMRDRLVQVQRLLSRDGSVWIHCDDAEMHRLRCLLDEVFGPAAFVATVVWQKRYSRENRPAIGTAHDYIVVCSPEPEAWKKDRHLLPPDDKTRRQYRNPNNDPRGPWRAIPMNAQGYRPNQMYDIVAPSGNVKRPPEGSCWKYIRGTFDRLVAEGRIYFGKDGDAQPSIIRYLDEVDGLTPWTWWPHDEAGHTDEAKREIQSLFPGISAFDTPKPERLMERVLHIATSPGDIVLDCFLGSGTTAAVAHKMRRRWVGIERSATTLDTYAIPRLAKVVAAEDPGGITNTVGWQGGGGFRILDVAPSMFEVADANVVIAEWASEGKLAEATAAQLGFSYQVDPPFVGQKGRSRLAVVDGLVSPDVARLLVDALAGNELLTLCGTAVDPATSEVLRELRRGSVVRKIPASILAEYRRPRWRFASPAAQSPEDMFDSGEPATTAA